jgi:hypothetical protein
MHRQEQLSSRNPAPPSLFNPPTLKLAPSCVRVAARWVKEKRSSVHINVDDTKRLLDLEMALFDSCSVPYGFAAVDLTCSPTGAGPFSFTAAPCDESYGGQAGTSGHSHLHQQQQQQPQQQQQQQRPTGMPDFSGEQERE